MNVGYETRHLVSENGDLKLYMVCDTDRYGHRVGDFDARGNYRSFYQAISYAVTGYVMEGGKFGSHSVAGDDRARVMVHWHGYQRNNGLEPVKGVEIRKPRNRKGYDIL